MKKKDLIWIEISKKSVKHNVGIVRKLIGRDVILSPCVKANAYGHGLVGYSKLLLRFGVDWLSVNSINEAEALRQGGIRAPIIIIGYVPKSDLGKVLKYRTRIWVYNRETVRELSRLARRTKQEMDVHIKVDTGMSRQGVLPGEVKRLATYIKSLPGLNLEGLATHYAKSDDIIDNSYFKKQFKIFQGMKDIIGSQAEGIFHCGNSAAVLLYPEAHFNMVRPGICVYGYYPGKMIKSFCRKKAIILQPSLSLKTKVALIKEVPRGTPIGYGCTYTTRRKSRLAILPVGYYDGIDRRLSNQGEVLIHGQRARILGRVCMNMIIVEVTKIRNVRLEDEAVIIGRQGKQEITAEEIADKIGTIHYEITTRLRESIPRYYI